MFSLTNVILCSMMFSNQDPEIVRLEPPQISKDTISEMITCTRPMRDGKFNISLEKVNEKTIVNCYGHGGSGWTTLFGSVDKAIRLFEESHPDKKTPIRVIGSGCMGLTSAIELTRLGYKVSRISTKSIHDITSWRAAGYFALVSVKTSPEEQEDLNRIGMHTFLTYQQIEKGLHPYISQKAVRFIPVYCSIDTEAGVEDLEARGLIPPKKYVTLDFGNRAIHQNYLEYKTFFMNTTTLMNELLNEALRLDLDVEIEHIHSYDQVEEEVIFNCSGLGAHELNQDPLLIPVRGHLLTLNKKSGSAHMNYMIYTKVGQDGNEEYIYLFSKDQSVTPEYPQGTPCSGVLGGSFIPHTDRLSPEELKELDRIEFEKLFRRNREFFHGATPSDK